MRIAHVVTLASPDGAYGGPLRVALNQAAALRELGHDVVLYSGYRGYPEPPKQISGVPVVLHPVLSLAPRAGFASLISPGMLIRLLGDLKAFDLVHVHLARDLITLPAAALARLTRTPFVVQTHGMIDHSDKPLSRPLDMLLTRPLLRSARRAFFLTPREQSELIETAGPRLRLANLPNGVPAQSPTIEAGALASRPLEVLFLARLQKRKRPVEFARMAGRLSGRYPEVKFTLLGPDEGEKAAVLAEIDNGNDTGQLRLEDPLPLSDTLDRMRKASVYVLPSVDEPFPMSVLEAMSIGLPVVITETCGLAGVVRENHAGIVIPDAGPSLDKAVERLITDEPLRREMGQNAARLVTNSFSIQAVARALETEYSLALSTTSRSDARPTSAETI